MSEIYHAHCVECGREIEVDQPVTDPIDEYSCAECTASYRESMGYDSEDDDDDEDYSF